MGEHSNESGAQPGWSACCSLKVAAPGWPLHLALPTAVFSDLAAPILPGTTFPVRLKQKTGLHWFSPPALWAPPQLRFRELKVQGQPL